MITFLMLSSIAVVLPWVILACVLVKFCMLLFFVEEKTRNRERNRQASATEITSTFVIKINTAIRLTRLKLNRLLF